MAFLIQLIKIKNRIPINPIIEKNKNLQKKEVKILCFKIITFIFVLGSNGNHQWGFTRRTNNFSRQKTCLR